MLSQRMTKDEIVKAIGSPQAIKGVIKNKYGQEIEVWEYEKSARELLGWACILNSRSPAPESLDATAVYWLRIVNGVLLSCRAAGDWEKEAGDIWEKAIVSPVLVPSDQQRSTTP
jgi:hypothetical protein